MNSLDRLVTRLFDYAGMFPPASLEFHEALNEAAAFPQTLTRPQMVAADMVVTPDHLRLIEDDTLLSSGFDGSRTVRICIVGVPLGESPGALDRIRAFHATARDAKVPRQVVALEIADDHPEERVEDKARALRQIALTTTGRGLALYYEPRWQEDDWTEDLDHIVNLIREAGASGRLQIGLKVRCAGPTAVGPPVLARILSVVADRRLPLKVTQGLHHPLCIPERDDARIGFLGLTVAHHMRIGMGDVFTREDIAACLTETDPKAFTFGDASVAWRDLELAHEPYERALVPPFNIGSCSLREPDEELEALFGSPS